MNKILEYYYNCFCYHCIGYIQYVDNYVTREYRRSKLLPRRFSGNGVWLCLLLPVALLYGTLKNKPSESYEISTMVALGSMLNSFIRLLIPDHEVGIFTQNITFSDVGNWVSAFFILICVSPCSNKGFFFNVLCAAFPSFTYHKLLYFIVKSFPLCFTFGEVSIVVQSVFVFITSYVTNIIDFSLTTATCYSISTLLFQGGVFAMLIQAALICKYPLLHKAIYFYASFVFVVAVFIILLPYYLIEQNPILWLFNLVFETRESVVLLCWWIACSILAGVCVFLQVKVNIRATTVNRKIFHILALAVFVPGLFVSPCFLYLATGVAFVAISFLEVRMIKFCLLIYFCSSIVNIHILQMIRALGIPPIGYLLQSGYEMFVDDRDEGVIALTPLYLIAGCSLPIWLYPGSLELLSLAPLAGLFTTALGDSVASTVGTWIGTHRWAGTQKTKEGSLFSFLSQVVMFLILYQSGMLREKAILWPIIVLAVTTIAEAKINQIDNIVLPLMAYTLLIINY